MILLVPTSHNLTTCFLLAYRARLNGVAAGVVLAVILAALLSSQFSGRQPATVAMDVGLSAIRLLLPLILVLLVQELLSREFDRRYYLNTLSYPHPRHRLLLSRIFVIATLTLGLLTVMAVALAATTWLIGRSYVQSTPLALGTNYLVTIAFIGLDSLVLIAVASLLAVIASTSSFILIGTFGFMLVARSFGAIIDLLTQNSSLAGDAEFYQASLSLLGYLLPDLGALDVRAITLYNRVALMPADWRWLVMSNAAYIAALLALALQSLQRKRFA